MKNIIAIFLVALLAACGGGEPPEPVANVPLPFRLASPVSGDTETVLHLYQALYGKAPSYTQLNTYKSQISANGAVAWANSTAAGLNNLSNADFAARVLNNISITQTSLTATAQFGTPKQAYDGLLGGFVEYLNYVGIANRGVVAAQLAKIISNLEVDAQFGVYGPAAISLNKQISANSVYSLNVASIADGTVPAARVYVIGASYSSDGPEDANLSTAVSGDSRNVNGPIGQALWVENYASAIGALLPVSVSRSISVGQSATNFARGGAYAIQVRTNPPTAKLAATDPAFVCNSGSVGCGDYNTLITKFPWSAYDQWLALAATAPLIGASDVFVFDAAQNDLVRYYRTNTGPAGNSFINDQADVVEGVVKLAIGLGFKKVVIANVPPVHLLPGSSGIGNTKLGNLASDVASLNISIGSKINSLKSTNAGVQFFKADWNSAFTNAINGAGIWNGVSATASVEGQSPGIATGQPTDLKVKWWDIANVHPSAMLHKYMADNFISLW